MERAIDYLLIGPVTADLQEDGGRKIGGTVSYAAPVGAAFRHQVRVLTSVAPDEPLLHELHPHADIHVKIAKYTTTFSNIYTSSGRVQFIHETSGNLTYDDIPGGWMSSQLVHLAPLADRVDPKIVDKFPNSTILLTPQGWMRRRDTDGRVRFKPWFDVDVVKQADIIVFSKQDIFEAPELEAKFAEVAKDLLVTNGSQGGTWYHHGVPTPYPPYYVDEVEPTGAGDIFAASLLSSLPRVEFDMWKAINIASRLAAISVTRVAMDSAPTQEEIQQTLTALG